jgi:hypothetical protein
LLSLGAAGSPARAKAADVKVAITSKSQAAVLDSGRLAVKVRANRKATVKLGARHGGKAVSASRRVRLSSGDRERLGLRLSNRGKRMLGSCGAQTITLRGMYGSRGKRRTATDRARLKRDPSRCEIHVEAPDADRCDPIDRAHCLLPFPNDYYTRPDPSTPTELRVDLAQESMPVNVDGLSAFTPEFNRNDGFSPNNTIMARVPGIEDPAAFRANRLVPQVNIGAYDNPGQRVVLINADSGERHPIWAEVDMVPDAPGDRALLIHPAAALDYGTRYIVALRNLRSESGERLRPNRVFRAYRERLGTDNAAVEARRPEMERIFDELGEAGIERGNLHVAWEFTVASQANLTGRLVAMRDDAFAQLGDTDLDDGEVQGVSPPVTITGETEYLPCDSDGEPECTLDSPTPESNYGFKKVTGTITVPCYMDAPGAAYNPADPDTPCAAGSRLHYEGGSETPSQNGDATWEAPFTCVIPRTAKGADEMATGMPGIYFGHGLLQNHRIVEQLGLFPAALEGVACGSDWIGLSAVDPITGDPYPGNDLTTYLLNMIGLKRDLSLFSALPDRSQQGYINALYLARAMAAPDGLGAEPEFEGPGSQSALDIDPDDTTAGLGYYGVSLGGIFGGATTAVAPDWERAVLSVPGMGFTTLLSRSTQFNQFLPAIYGAYPDELARQVGISALQLLWDRGEPSAYVHGMLDGRFGAPEHRVMLHEAFGDHQVANVQTETLGRSLGAAVRTPAVTTERLNSREYLFSDVAKPFYTPAQALIDSADLNVPGGFETNASLFTIDTGVIRAGPGGAGFVGTNPNLDWNIAPVDATTTEENDGLDPHEPAATSPAAQQLAIPFLLGQGVYDACVSEAPGPMDMPPWPVPYTGTPAPCTAPPLHEPGQGS